jgi:hypothetical protein
VTPHFEGCPPNQNAYAKIPTTASGGLDLSRQMEIGYGTNVKIVGGGNVRCNAGAENIGILYGDGGSTKRCQDLRVSNDTDLSGSGLNCAGIVVMPSAVAGDSTVFEPSLILTAAAHVNVVDPRGVLRQTHPVEQRVVVPAGLASTPNGYSIRFPASYATDRPWRADIDGDVNDRFRGSLAASSSGLELGDGTNAPVNAIRYNFTPGIKPRVEVGVGIPTMFTGSWDAPLIVGGVRIWSSGFSLYSKSSDPENATDGNALMRKVAYPAVLTGSTATAGLPGYFAISTGGTLMAIYTGDGATHAWVFTRLAPFKASVSMDWPSIPAGGTATTTVEVGGAVSGDRAIAAMVGGSGGLILFAEGTGANLVTVRAFNPTSAPIDLTVRTLSVTLVV